MPVRGPPENDGKVRQQGRRQRETQGVHVGTLRVSSNENAAGGLSHHSLPSAWSATPNHHGSETRGVYPEPCRRAQTVFAKEVGFGAPAQPRPRQETNATLENEKMGLRRHLMLLKQRKAGLAGGAIRE